MGNTKAGGQTLRETMIAKHGSEKAWKEHMRRIATKGGSNGNKARGSVKGFAAMSREEVARAGSRGGRISRRGRAK